MAECYIIDSPAVGLSASTARSVLVATAGSAQPFRPILFSVSCEATATGLLKVEFLVGTVSGGTTGTAPNVARMNAEGYAKAPITTASMYTAEPTYTKHASNGALVVQTKVIPLPAGPFEIEYPLGRDFYCPTSTVFAVRLTATTVGPNSYTALAIEE